MKKFCFYVLFILIISIGSISYGASFSIATIQNTVDYLKQEGYLPNFSRTNITDDRNYINNNAFKSYGIITTSSRVFLVFSFNNTIDNKNSCQSWLLNGSNFRNNQNWNSISFDNVDMAYSPYGISIFGIPANEIYDKNKPQFDFEPNYFQKVFYTGINDEFNALKYDYSISSWKLGTFEEIPDDVDKIIVDLHLADGGIVLPDSFLTFTKSFNNGYYFITNDNLYVYSRYIKYNTKYNLLFYLYDDNNNFIESYQYNYVFLPTNATIQNGVVISPGSGDYSVQDSTNDTILNLNDTTVAYDTMARLNESGELIQQLNYKVYPNHSYDILFAMTQNIVNTLYDSGDVYLDIDFEHNGYVHRVYSSQFITPINRITSWIILAVNFGFVYLLYKQGAELIHTIQEGDLYVLELEDANEYFYM